MESLCCPSLKETPKYVKHIELGFISHFETSVRDKTFLVHTRRKWIRGHILSLKLLPKQHLPLYLNGGVHVLFPSHCVKCFIPFACLLTEYAIDNI